MSTYGATYVTALSLKLSSKFKRHWLRQEGLLAASHTSLATRLERRHPSTHVALTDHALEVSQIVLDFPNLRSKLLCPLCTLRKSCFDPRTFDFKHLEGQRSAEQTRQGHKDYPCQVFVDEVGLLRNLRQWRIDLARLSQGGVIFVRRIFPLFIIQNKPEPGTGKAAGIWQFVRTSQKVF